MRKQWIGACLLLAAAFAGSSANRARAQQTGPSNAPGSLNGPQQSGQTEIPGYQTRPEQGPSDTPGLFTRPPLAAPADVPVFPANGQEAEPYYAPPAMTVRGQEAGMWDVSGQPSVNTPLPLGPSRADTGGLYIGAEFIFFNQSKPIGNQVIATRGFRDTDGSLVGVPGQYVGSNNQAMSTQDFGRTNWAPGYRATIGYKMEDGTSFSVSYLQLQEVKYNFSVGPISPDQNPGPSQADTLLYSPVYGFSPQFSGPQGKVLGGSGNSPYGIWNGASTMSEVLVDRFTNWDFTFRTPVYESELAKSYALAGGRFAWFWDEFRWNTQDLNSSGVGGPQDGANYTNVMSQRMYGPFVGIGNDVYLGNNFAMSGELTAAALLNVIKTRAAYTLGDRSIEDKTAFEYYSIVPNINLNASLWWYPIEGVQVRLGYNLMSFFDAQYMQEPVGFNAGGPDPSYKTQLFRYMQGFNIGIGYSF